MTPKPHRVFLDRVSGYAGEASAFMRRRRHTRRSFARTYHAGGRSTEHLPESESGVELFEAASELLELTRET